MNKLTKMELSILFCFTCLKTLCGTTLFMMKQTNSLLKSFGVFAVSYVIHVFCPNRLFLSFSRIQMVYILKTNKAKSCKVTILIEIVLVQESRRDYG